MYCENNSKAKQKMHSFFYKINLCETYGSRKR